MEPRAVSVIALAALLGTQLWLRPLVSDAKKKKFLSLLAKIWLAGGALIISGLVQETRALYSTWQNEPLTALLLPPHRSIAYFLSYVGWRYWMPWIIALTAAWAAYYFAALLNRRAGERFFESEEPLMFAAATFFAGYPGIIFYILTLGIAALLLTFTYHLLKLGRAPLYFLWFGAALFAILITYGWLPADLLVKFNL